MTDKEINERIASITGFHDKVGLKKRGLWYRPYACGYTNREEEAGRYTIEEAKDHAHPDGEPVTIHKFSTPNYAESLDACSGFEQSIAFQSDMSPVVYVHTLAMLSGDITGMAGILTITSSARKRCEAFLRLKGQWDENRDD